MAAFEVNRRKIVFGIGIAAALAPLPGWAKTTPPVPAAPHGSMLGTDFGIIADDEIDQSALFQKAVNAASGVGVPLVLVGGRYVASNVKIPYGCTILGAAGAAEINAPRDEPIFVADDQPGIVLENLNFQGYIQEDSKSAIDGRSGLLAFRNCDGLRLTALRLGTGHGNGIYLENCSGRLTGSDVTNFDATAIFVINSHDLVIAQNRVANCRNGGIRIWRDQAGVDGTIVSANHITDIEARAGGSGQNGNGINVYKADEVVISDNVIARCAFSAVRVNTGKNVTIRGNTCTNSGEVGIYSEFAFSGSIIANNIVDGATGGISITNLDQNGHLAVCSGNIVRNIVHKTNPQADDVPYGIYAEAETSIVGNTVENVPGFGIIAGNGAFLRNVVIASNVVSSVAKGIGVSVANAGPVSITGNIISGATENGIVGLNGIEVVSDDLVRDAPKYPNVTIAGNTVAG